MNVRGILKTVSTPQRQGRQTTFLVLLLLSCLPYANSLAGKFVAEDHFQVVENPYAHSFHYLPRIFGTTVWSFRGPEGASKIYRPMMSLSYLLLDRIAGANPFAFHMTNLLLNFLAVWLVFAVVRRLSGERVAMVAAGLFALHPVHTEAVAWIGGMPDIELAVFTLLTFLIYLRTSKTSPGIFSQAGIGLSFALALLCGEQALLLPVLVTIFEHVYRDDRAVTVIRQKFARYAPLWLVAIVNATLRLFVPEGGGSIASAQASSVHGAIASAISTVGTSLGDLIWPQHLSSYDSFCMSAPVSDPSVLAGLAAIAVCGVLFFFLWRRVRILSFSLLWIFFTIAPMLNPRWTMGGFFAERYLYVPSVGMCWLAGWAAVVAWSGEAPFLPRALSRAIPAALLIVAMLYGVRTTRRNKVWSDDGTLYRDTLDARPNAGLIRARLGEVLFKRGDFAGAEQEWQKVLSESHAGEADVQHAETLSDLGSLRNAQYRSDDALGYFDEAIRIEPEYLDANLGLAETLAGLKRSDEAAARYRTALVLSPLSVKAHNDYAKFLFGEGRVDEARGEYQRSIGVDPSAEAYDVLGDIYVKWQDWMRAEAAYENAIQLNGADSRADFGLGKPYEADGRPGDALRMIEHGLAIDPSDADARAEAIRLRGSAPQLPATTAR